MNSEMPRFWPQNPGQQPDGPQPEDILRAAAAELGPATEFEVVAELDTRVTGEWLEHAFYLVSEKVGYRYLLFRARHRLGFPVDISDHPAVETETEPFASEEGTCESGEALEQMLKQLFEHPATQRIVGQLRNLSREAS